MTKHRATLFAPRDGIVMLLILVVAVTFQPYLYASLAVKGLLLYCESSVDKPSKANVFAFSSMEQFPAVTVAVDAEGNQRTFRNNLIADIVRIPTESSFPNIVDDQSSGLLRQELSFLTDKCAEYVNLKPYLQVPVAYISGEINKWQSGKVKLDGEWITKAEYDTKMAEAAAEDKRLQERIADRDKALQEEAARNPTQQSREPEIADKWQPDATHLVTRGEGQLVTGNTLFTMQKNVDYRVIGVGRSGGVYIETPIGAVDFANAKRFRVLPGGNFAEDAAVEIANVEAIFRIQVGKPEIPYHNGVPGTYATPSFCGVDYSANLISAQDMGHVYAALQWYINNESVATTIQKIGVLHANTPVRIGIQLPLDVSQKAGTYTIHVYSGFHEIKHFETKKNGSAEW